LARESLEKLINLFNLTSKRDVVKYCKNLVVTSEDLADILLVANVTGFGKYHYIRHFKEVTTEHLQPKAEEFAAFARNGIGSLKGLALKHVRKIDQTFRDRRLLAIHLFYLPSHKIWHLFYFDQRDYQKYNNHWKHGPYIHYSSDVFTNKPLQEIWSNITSGKPSFPTSIHIKYDYHHNRNR
jgi:hypothetical protein